MIQPGQKMIMSPLTIVDAVNAVILAGGVPVFCDINRESCAIDPGTAETLIDADTAAIVITHLHGQTAGAYAFRDICTHHGLGLIEDAAQAFSAIEGGRRLGTIGDVGIYSFGFFKNLTTWRGGMVVSNNTRLIERIRNRVHDLPQVPRWKLATAAVSGLLVDVGTWPPVFANIAYPVVRRGFGFVERRLDPEANSSRLKMTPKDYLCRMRHCQATIGLRQLVRVDAETTARITRAKQYHEGLVDVPGILKPPPAYDFSNIFTYFPVQVQRREQLLEYARERGRDFAAQHLRNCADLPEFQEYSRDCPNARVAAEQLVLLPTYPRYPESEVQLNVEVLKEFALQHPQ
jgi:dTDP-4-amino-4,6-dideoxygalactose transaminase